MKHSFTQSIKKKQDRRRENRIFADANSFLC